MKLLIIGDEVNKYGALRRSVEAAGVRQDVRFFGFVPERTLAALYRLASVFAFPSLYEGFGLPPLEAMACGTPVVTSRHLVAARGRGRRRACSSIPTAWTTSRTAWSACWATTRCAPTSSPRGRERVAHFSWERSVRKPSTPAT